MTYDADDESVEGSAPVELFDFLLGPTHYRVTTWQADYVFGGHTFGPLTGVRGAMKASSAQDAPYLEVTVPGASALGAALVALPRQVMTCTVYRVQAGGDYITPWSGPLAAVSLSGRWVKAQVPSVLARVFEDELPPRAHQPHCNHDLYGHRCGIDPTSSSPGGIPYKRATTIVSASGTDVVVASVGTFPDHWCSGDGVLEHVASGERRRIAEQIGTAISLSWPLVMANGDAVNLYASCDHNVKTGCRDKFDNVDNYGGTPWVPQRSPFRYGLRVIK